MNILVTGGAGFIGSHVCDKLLKRKEKVICLDNFNDYYDPNIKENNIAHNLSNPNFKLYREDILNFNSLDNILVTEKIDKIIHLAARAGVRPSIKDPFLYQEVNIKGTLNLLELTRKYKIQNFVFASSSSVYGNRENGPFKETDNVDNPISPYAMTKKAGELLCYTYHHLYRLNVSCLRFFTVYGPRGRPDMAPLMFTDKIAKGQEIEVYGEGNTKRDYTYVSDIVNGVISALDHNYSYEIFNLGGGNPVDLNYFISLIERETGKKALRKQLPLQQGDVGITSADVSKAERMLGYKPKVRIEEGIKKLVEWYKLKNE